MIADKHASPPFATAHGEITREFGRQFDPQVVQAFLSISEQVLEGIRLGIPGPHTNVRPRLSAVAVSGRAA